MSPASCRNDPESMKAADWLLTIGSSDSRQGQADCPVLLGLAHRARGVRSGRGRSAHYIILRSEYGDGDMRRGDLRRRPSGRSPDWLSHFLGIATSRPPVVCRGVGAGAWGAESGDLPALGRVRRTGRRPRHPGHPQRHLPAARPGRLRLPRLAHRCRSPPTGWYDQGPTGSGPREGSTADSRIADDAVTGRARTNADPVPRR